MGARATTPLVVAVAVVVSAATALGPAAAVARDHPTLHAGAADARTAAPAAMATATATGPARAIVGDFNGDGRDDVLAYTPGTGADRLWYGGAAGFVRGPAVVVNGVYEPLVGDFDGDHRSDILWYDRADGNRSSVWFGSASGFTPGAAVDAPVGDKATVYQLATGDFNGDGRSDVAFFDVGPGVRKNRPSIIWYGGARTFSSAALAAATCGTQYGTPVNGAACVALAGDFNRDGFDDLLVYRAGPQADRVQLGTADGLFGHWSFSVSGSYVPLVGDFNGDGRSDAFWYAPGRGADYIWYGEARNFVQGPPTAVNGAYEPLVGDFDGNGFDDILWYAPGSAADHVWFAHATGFDTSAPIAVNGTYAPAVGDFNGDGQDDVLWFATYGGISRVWYGTPHGTNKPRFVASAALAL